MVGLARVDSLSDLAVDLISAAANPVVGLIKHPGSARRAEEPAAGQPVMPVRVPATTLEEITAAARTHLPGVTVQFKCTFVSCHSAADRALIERKEVFDDGARGPRSGGSCWRACGGCRRARCRWNSATQ